MEPTRGPYTCKVFCNRFRQGTQCILHVQLPFLGRQKLVCLGNSIRIRCIRRVRKIEIRKISTIGHGSCSEVFKAAAVLGRCQPLPLTLALTWGVCSGSPGSVIVQSKLSNANANANAITASPRSAALHAKCPQRTGGAVHFRCSCHSVVEDGGIRVALPSESLRWYSGLLSASKPLRPGILLHNP